MDNHDVPDPESVFEEWWRGMRQQGNLIAVVTAESGQRTMEVAYASGGGTIVKARYFSDDGHGDASVNFSTTDNVNFS